MIASIRLIPQGAVHQVFDSVTDSLGFELNFPGNSGAGPGCGEFENLNLFFNSVAYGTCGGGNLKLDCFLALLDLL